MIQFFYIKIFNLTKIIHNSNQSKYANKMDIEFDTIPVYDEGRAAFGTPEHGLEWNIGAYLEQSSKNNDFETSASVSSEINISPHQWMNNNSQSIPIAESQIFQVSLVPEHMQVITPPTEPVRLPQNKPAQNIIYNQPSTNPTTTTYANMVINS